MEIEVKVSPHSYSMHYYQIHWRKKKRFNLFNFWKRMVTVWNGATLTYDQPVLYSNFDDAIAYASRLKANPKLIEEHYKKQAEIYKNAKEERQKNDRDRNKTKILK